MLDPWYSLGKIIILTGIMLLIFIFYNLFLLYQWNE